MYMDIYAFVQGYIVEVTNNKFLYRSEMGFPFSDILYQNSAYGQTGMLEESVQKYSICETPSSRFQEPVYEVVYDN